MGIPRLHVGNTTIYKFTAVFKRLLSQIQRLTVRLASDPKVGYKIKIDQSVSYLQEKNCAWPEIQQRMVYKTSIAINVFITILILHTDPEKSSLFQVLFFAKSAPTGKILSEYNNHPFNTTLQLFICPSMNVSFITGHRF